MAVPVAVPRGRAHGEEGRVGSGRAAFPDVFERTAIVMAKGHAKVHRIRGKMKETLGKALGDKSMQRSGRGEQLRARAHEMTEKAAHQLRKRTGH
ncbi:CsbD family protein [Streptomyces sp. NPDC001530]|uniref:CsbD family protein n=1 Tax=Streptomyces sp. NPDC001530 TaxID=3364582 RepID=UPI0036B7F443